MLTAVRPQPYYLDIIHRDANKGPAVRAICRRPGRDKRTWRYRDMTNDVSMCVRAGFAIAMGSAPGAVRAIAAIRKGREVK